MHSAETYCKTGKEYCEIEQGDQDIEEIHICDVPQHAQYEIDNAFKQEKIPILGPSGPAAKPDILCEYGPNCFYKTHCCTCLSLTTILQPADYFVL